MTKRFKGKLIILAGAMVLLTGVVLLLRFSPSSMVGSMVPRCVSYITAPLDTPADCRNLITRMQKDRSTLEFVGRFGCGENEKMLLTHRMGTLQKCVLRLQQLEKQMENCHFSLPQDTLTAFYAEDTETQKVAAEKKKWALEHSSRVSLLENLRQLGFICDIINLRITHVGGMFTLYDTLSNTAGSERCPGKVKIPEQFRDGESMEIGLVMQGDKPSCFVDEYMYDIVRYDQIWRLMGLATSKARGGVLYNPRAIEKIMKSDPGLYSLFGKTPEEVVNNAFSRMDSVGELLGYGRARNMCGEYPCISINRKSGNEQIMGFRIRQEEIADLAIHYRMAGKNLTRDDVAITLTYTPSRAVREKYGIKEVQFKLDKMAGSGE